MRLRDKIILVVSVVLAAALLITAGSQLDYLNSQRQEMQLINNEPLENAPPSLAFATTAMGAFRGLVVDILWLRADRLKQSGQFFDAKQLADWITIMQPRLVSVWEFQSWNMAYNISVAIPNTEPEQRWQWVRNGYELVRDRGLELNPNSILLYRQIAFIFQHKIGSVADDVHKYYKLQLAAEMEPLLGSADEKYFEALAKAPKLWEQIAGDAEVAPLIEALKAADKVFADNEKFVENYLSLRQNPQKFKAEAFEVIDYFRAARALAKFDIFAKAWYFRNRLKMDLEFMQELNNTYGPVNFDDPNDRLPLDWRHPDSHAIYWAIRGLRVAGNKDEFSVDEANTDRIVAHSLQNLFRSGRIFIYEGLKSGGEDSAEQVSAAAEKTIFLRQDLRMFDSYNKAILDIIDKYTEPNDYGLNSHQIGHLNMLQNAVLSFYQAGHTPQAQKLYKQIQQLYPDPKRQVPMAVFVRNQLRAKLENLVVFEAQRMIQMLLQESYFRYAMRDDNAAAMSEKWAQQVHEQYRKENEDEYRINLPEFKMMRYFALMDFLNDGQYPPTMRQSLMGRIKIEKPELFEQLLRQQEKLLKQNEQNRQ